MPLIPLRPLMEAAEAHNYAQGAFNVNAAEIPAMPLPIITQSVMFFTPSAFFASPYFPVRRQAPVRTEFRKNGAACIRRRRRFFSFLRRFARHGYRAPEYGTLVFFRVFTETHVFG